MRVGVARCCATDLSCPRCSSSQPARIVTCASTHHPARHPIGFGLPSPSASSSAVRLAPTSRPFSSAWANIFIVWSQTRGPRSISLYLPSTRSSPAGFESQSSKYAPEPLTSSEPSMTSRRASTGMPGISPSPRQDVPCQRRDG